MRTLFSQLLRLWSIRLVLIGAFFMLFGTGLNYLTIQANDNFMPVASTRGEIFFVIGSDEHLGGFESNDVMDDAHRKMTSTDRLSFLSDRILIIPNDTSALFENMCAKVRLTRLCPLSASLRMASIGDLLIWTGIPFLFLSILVLCIKITYQSLYFCINKTTRK